MSYSQFDRNQIQSNTADNFMNMKDLSNIMGGPETIRSQQEKDQEEQNKFLIRNHANTKNWKKKKAKKINWRTKKKNKEKKLMQKGICLVNENITCSKGTYSGSLG